MSTAQFAARIAKTAGIPPRTRPHPGPTPSGTPRSPTPSTPASPCATPSSGLGRPRGPRTTEHYDRVRGNLDRHGVYFLTASVPGV